MIPKTRKRYTEEFKSQVVELLLTGKDITELSEELCISTSLLYKWRRDHLSPVVREGDRAVGERPEADDRAQLQRENTLLRQENEILKKAAVILGTRARDGSER